MTYQIGKRVRSSVVFRDVAGAATDPSTVVFKVRTPSGSETTYTYGVDAAVVKDATGTYHVDVTLTAAKRWSFRWNGTGALIAASETSIEVEPSAFVRPL